MWQRVWLYIRLGLFVLLVAFVVQMLIANVARQGTDKPSLTFVGTDFLGGAWSLLVAFVLGMFAVTLWRGLRKAWGDFRADRARQRSEQAERDVQGALSEIRELDQSARPSQAEPERKPTGPLTHPVAPHEGDRQAKRDAADIWTGGEESDENERKKS